MNKASQILFKVLAIVFFLLAVASILATLFAASGSSRSPGLFLTVVLAGLGKWLFGRSQGKSARETFGRAIEVAKSSNAAMQQNQIMSEKRRPRNHSNISRIGQVTGVKVPDLFRRISAPNGSECRLQSTSALPENCRDQS